MATTTKAKPQTELEHVADKLARYKFRLVRFTDDLDVVELKPDDPRDKSDPIIMEVCWDGNGDMDGWKYHGPPWKKHHEEYYALAAAEWLIAKRDNSGRLVPQAKPEEPETVPGAGNDGPVPLPPKGPACPKCGTAMTYEQAYVGGRGYCWRRHCPGLDNGACDHFERWAS